MVFSTGFGNHSAILYAEASTARFQHKSLLDSSAACSAG